MLRQAAGRSINPRMDSPPPAAAPMGPAAGKIDESRPFQPVRIAVLTVSDTRTEADDKSGRTLAELIQRDRHILAARAIVKDDKPAIVGEAQGVDRRSHCRGGDLHRRHRRHRPRRDAGSVRIRLREKDRRFRRALPHAELAEDRHFDHAEPRAGGVAGGTYLFALPGSPGACRDGWEDILRWQLDIRFRPCNLAELMPRLQEHLKK